MILFLRALPGLVVALLISGFAVALRVPGAFWLVAGLATVLPTVALWLITRRAALPRSFFGLAIFPALATLGSFGVLLFSEHLGFQVVLVASVVGLQAFFLDQAFRFTFQPARYEKNALTNLGQLAAVVALFFFTLTLFDLALFATFPLSLQAPIFALLLVCWFAGLAYLVQADRQTTRVYGVVTVLVGLELYVLLNRLPPLPTVKAGLLIVVMGYAVQLLRGQGATEATRPRWPVTVLILMLLCLVVTARWFA